MAIAIAVLAAGSAAPAAATCTRYASPQGSDTAAGTAEAPYKTAQRLVDTLRAGETGCLRAGTYSEGVLRFGAAGTSTAPITLTSAPGERATVRATYVYVPKGANNVTISGLDIDGQPTSQPSFQVMAFDTTIEDNTITNHNLAETCLILGSLSGYGQAQRTIVRRNRFSDCGNPVNGMHDHAIYVESTTDVKITDNVFWNAAAWAIQLYPDAQRTQIAHNVIDASNGGIIVAGESSGGEYSADHASSDTTVEYNVITNAKQEYAVQTYWGGPSGTGNVARANCVFGNAKGDVDTSDGGLTASGNVHADPLYVDAAKHDYRLRTGSPCMSVVGYDAAAKQQGTGSGGAIPPAIDLTDPKPGATFAGYVCPNATATDDKRVTRVRFFVDKTLLLDDTSAPFGSCVPTDAIPAGAHSFAAIAYDADGGKASATILVTRGDVASPGTASAPPSVTLTAPGGGTSFGAQLCPTASASDDKRVVRVRFYVDDVLMLADDTAPYEGCFATSSLAAGTHKLDARSYDADGSYALSQVMLSK